MNYTSAPGPLTIYVDDDNTTGIEDGSPGQEFTTVQEALSNSRHGDIIRVAPGTYSGPIVITQDNISLYGEIAALTVLDAINSGTVIDIDGRTNIHIEGFTLRNGQADFGGGININNSSEITIKANQLFENIANISGGGIAITGSSSSIMVQENILAQNTATSSGSGIYIDTTEIFADPNAVDTTATFATKPGVYVLHLTADDTELTAYDEVTITVSENDNHPIANFSALPKSGVAPLSISFTDLSVGTISNWAWDFDNNGTIDSSEQNPTFIYNMPGTYAVTLTVTGLEGTDIATKVDFITVDPEPTTYIEEVRVTADSDDAEESESGSMNLVSSDLELTYDGSNQAVGIRFNGVNIPTGATITNAYIQFKTDETTSEETSLTIQGEAVDNAQTFSSATRNISSRPHTTSAVIWSPAPWANIGEAGSAQRTPDISSVIQEIVDRPGWSNNNSQVFIFTGTGDRIAESYNGDSAGAPLLHVEYVAAFSGNQPPVVDAGVNQLLLLPTNTVQLDGTVADDGLPNGSGVTTLWSYVSDTGEDAADEIKISNNTIVNNISLAGSIHVENGTPEIRNCIFWNNSEENLSGVSDTMISYSLIGDGTFAGMNNNIEGDPLFMDFYPNDYHLTPCSPGVDAGDPADDFLLEPSPNGGRINLGAYGNTSEATISDEWCSTGLLGICDAGMLICSGGTKICVADIQPGEQPEGPFGEPSCSDGEDNDCDGEVDGADLGGCIRQCESQQLRS
jgi:PKD repeat protein